MWSDQCRISGIALARKCSAIIKNIVDIMKKSSLILTEHGLKTQPHTLMPINTILY